MKGVLEIACLMHRLSYSVRNVADSIADNEIFNEPSTSANGSGDGSGSVYITTAGSSRACPAGSASTFASPRLTIQVSCKCSSNAVDE